MTCEDQEQPTQTPKARNTNRGLRNPNTIEIRREKRTNKRRVARRKKRKEEGGGGNHREHTEDSSGHGPGTPKTKNETNAWKNY